MKGSRLSSPEIVAILLSHLLDKVPISDRCDYHGITPQTFCHWQKIFFENGQAAFAKDRKANKAEASRSVAIRAVPFVRASAVRSPLGQRTLRTNRTGQSKRSPGFPRR